MAALVQFQRQVLDYTTSLFNEGYLDVQFTRLQQLTDESNPDLVVQVASLFFRDSPRILNDLTAILNHHIVEFERVDKHVVQLKGSSSSIGAQRVHRACIVFRDYCDQQNTEGCLRCLQQVKNEFYLVKNKLETLFKLQQQLVAAGGVIPM